MRNKRNNVSMHISRWRLLAGSLLCVFCHVLHFCLLLKFNQSQKYIFPLPIYKYMGVFRIESWIKENKGFMLRDDYLIDDPHHGDMKDHTWSGKFRGRMVVTYPDNYHGYDLNPTTYPGRFPIFWVMLTILPAHAAAKIIKFDERIGFGNPGHQKFMQTIEHQKEELQTKIKQGLISISQTISDLELLEHDLRKYREYKKYIDDYYATGDDEETKKRKKLADRFLKMIFVEQVDYHVGSTGQGPGRFSMAFMRNNNIMPTIVDDFLEIEKLEDIDEILMKEKKISGAERNILITKFKAFQEWLNLFKEAVETRLKRLEELKRSREKTVEEFKKWVKPHIIRLKALSINEDLSAGETYKKSSRFTQITGLYRYNATLWIIKDFMLPWDRMEYRKSTMEYDFATNPEEKYFNHPLNPYNKWTQEHLVFNYDYGLLADYPWMTKELADEWAKKAWKGFLSNQKFILYYVFNHIVVKNDIYYPLEVEDIDIIYSPILMSHNAVLVKFMENDAHQKQFDMEVEEYIGHITPIEGKSVVTYYKKGSKYELTQGFLKRWLNSSPSSWVYKVHKERIEEIKRRLKEKGFKLDENNIVLNKKEFFDVFDENDFHHVQNYKENKLVSWIEDNVLGHSLNWRYRGPYNITFKDTTTYVFYKALYKEHKKLVVDPVMKALKFP